MFARPLIQAVLLALFTAACAAAQTAGGSTVQGTIRDAAGGVIPGAAVAITHIDTGVKASTTANHDGYFTFPPVPNGSTRSAAKRRA
jgi:hypothetical protein